MSYKTYLSQPLSKELCEKWDNNKLINPITNHKIKETGSIYKELKRNCPKIINPAMETTNNKNLTKELCEKWTTNKLINPITNHKIKENGAIYKKLKKNCDILLKKNLNDIYALKIQKFILPFITKKKVSPNIIDRINYYLIIHNYMLSIYKKYKNNCMKPYKYDNKGKLLFRIGNRIILEKKIGRDSKYGIIYLAHYKNLLMHKFAVKITDNTSKNNNEILILRELTKQVINFNCPNFPLTYGALYCINENIDNNFSNENTIDPIIHKLYHDKNIYPRLIQNNSEYNIQINELADGDFIDIITANLSNTALLLNALAQAYIAIMFFHKYINATHNDTHAGNFLYHKINPGGYFHYNIFGSDYYIENMGYLWIIWDFGIIIPFTNSKKINNNKFGPGKSSIATHDYYKLISVFSNNTLLFQSDLIISIQAICNDLLFNNKYKQQISAKLLRELEKKILVYMIKFIPSFTTSTPSHIINKKPYII
jgi:hypothetical protein